MESDVAIEATRREGVTCLLQSATMRTMAVSGNSICRLDDDSNSPGMGVSDARVKV